MPKAKSKTRSLLDTIKLAAEEFNVETKYVDLTIRVSLYFAEVCGVLSDEKGLESLLEPQIFRGCMSSARSIRVFVLSLTARFHMRECFIVSSFDCAHT
jgi:hypothetical protein